MSELSSTRYGDQPGPLAVAHRGGAGLAPENTLQAFRMSHSLGLRYLETDVRMTADGVLVTFHDATLDRVTDGSGPLARTSYAELSRLRVHGSEPIPTLLEVLQEFPDARLVIDVKDPNSVGPLARLLIETGAAGRVCLAGAWDRSLRALREQVGPQLSTALGWRELAGLVCGSALPAGRQRPARSAAFAHVPQLIAGARRHGPRLLERANRAGISVIVWTVDDPDRMRRHLDAGARGIITDRPDLLRELLISRGQWTAPVSTIHTTPAAAPAIMVQPGEPCERTTTK